MARRLSPGSSTKRAMGYVYPSLSAEISLARLWPIFSFFSCKQSKSFRGNETLLAMTSVFVIPVCSLIVVFSIAWLFWLRWRNPY
jgi:hypothetical protein